MRELRLFIGGKFTGLTVKPDDKWPSMWRIHFGERVSDMVNVTRAKDAAIGWVRPRGLGGKEIAHWKVRETPPRAPQPARLEKSDPDIGSSPKTAP